VELTIEGNVGGVWTLARVRDGWLLNTGPTGRPSTRVALDQETAWKLFSKSLSAERAARDLRIEGDPRLGRPLLGALAVMA
jgi:hypothetical protein